jgi:inosose dehydratase
VCEVPGWGAQLTPHRVLAEMREVGLTATEYGPVGYLSPETLSEYGMAVVGGFVPVVLHDPSLDVDAIVDDAPAGVLVLAAATGLTGYDDRPELDATGWATLLSNLARIVERAAERGRTAALHPHVGTIVERPDEVRRVLDGSGVPLCLDTGHLLIGGTDPARLAKDVPDRVAHVHLKDVDGAWAAGVRDGDLGYQAAVRQGLYRPLGRGDVDIAGIVSALDGAGYTGWYVLEQDTVLDAEPPAGTGPIEDVRASLAYLKTLAGAHSDRLHGLETR